MKNRRVFALSMAVLWGIAFANALHDATIGTCTGPLMGWRSGCSITRMTQKTIGGA